MVINGLMGVLLYFKSEDNNIMIMNINVFQNDCGPFTNKPNNNPFTTQKIRPWRSQLKLWTGLNTKEMVGIVKQIQQQKSSLFSTHCSKLFLQYKECCQEINKWRNKM